MQCKSVTPYLWMNETSEQAAEFYNSVFDDSEILTTSEGPKSVTMRIAGLEFTMFDAGPHFQLNEAFSLMVSVETQEEVDYFWEKLTDGGSESECGWLKDRFGVSWQIVPTALWLAFTGDDPEGRERALKAMFTMKKLVVADLEAAYAGE